MYKIVCLGSYSEIHIVPSSSCRETNVPVAISIYKLYVSNSPSSSKSSLVQSSLGDYNSALVILFDILTRIVSFIISKDSFFILPHAVSSERIASTSSLENPKCENLSIKLESYQNDR